MEEWLGSGIDKRKAGMIQPWLSVYLDGWVGVCVCGHLARLMEE